MLTSDITSKKYDPWSSLFCTNCCNIMFCIQGIFIKIIILILILNFSFYIGLEKMSFQVSIVEFLVYRQV